MNHRTVFMGEQTYPSTTLLPVQVLQDLIDGSSGLLTTLIEGGYRRPKPPGME